MTLFLIVNCLEGLAIAFSYPAKQALLIQASPRRWIGTVTGVESTAMQAAGLLGSLTAPIVYGWISGYILALAGAINLLGGSLNPFSIIYLVGITLAAAIIE